LVLYDVSKRLCCSVNIDQASSCKIHSSRKIHSSLLSNPNYIPKARLVEGGNTFWDRRSDQNFKSKWVEFDLYKYAASAIEKFIDEPDMASETLSSIAKCGKLQFFPDFAHHLDMVI